MSLEDLRKQIDDLDTRIVELIAERQKVSQKIGKSKKVQKLLVEDRGRESKVIEHVKSLARGKNINDADVECIFRLMIAASKKIQGIEVAFQGEMGAYSEEAVFHFFGSSVQVRPRETLEEVFKIVESEEVPYGMVPIENSLEGSISRTYDLMLESALKVYGETEVRVIHCLIGTPEASLDTIKRVYSHPQALGQCRNFLKKLSYEMVPTYDTAGSVKMIREKGTTDVAAIASARAAEIYGMKIIAQSIEDNPNNFTRFFVLSKEDAQPTGNDKTSIVFSAKDRPGALYECLTEFASRKINLTKLESRPTRQRPWEYNFYLDFDGHRQDKLASEALAGVEKNSIFLKVLGSYPKAR
ncbi:MAG: prephenate dehydratase [Dehalococcoidales bacterium]|nr:prephenate dehydratase [Dehalococcoidales bacterium]